MGTGQNLKVVPWQRAAKYDKRAVFIRRESDHEYLRLAPRGIRKQGPNLRVVLEDGRVVWQADGSRLELTALPESLLRETKA